MNRREWLKGMIAAAAGIVTAPVAPAIPAPVVAAAAVPAPAAVASAGMMDIRDILTRNMLLDIQEEEDRRFIAYVESLNLEEMENLYEDLYEQETVA